MPAYISLDISGIPKDILVKKHYEIKNKIFKSVVPGQYQNKIKDEINGDLDKYKVPETV